MLIAAKDRLFGHVCQVVTICNWLVGWLVGWLELNGAFNTI